MTSSLSLHPHLGKVPDELPLVVGQHVLNFLLAEGPGAQQPCFLQPQTPPTAHAWLSSTPEGLSPPPRSSSLSPTGSVASPGVPARLRRRLLLMGVSWLCGRSMRFRMGRMTLLGMEGERNSCRHLLRLEGCCWGGEEPHVDALGSGHPQGLP